MVVDSLSHVCRFLFVLKLDCDVGRWRLGKNAGLVRRVGLRSAGVAVERSTGRPAGVDVIVLDEPTAHCTLPLLPPKSTRKKIRVSLSLSRLRKARRPCRDRAAI